MYLIHLLKCFFRCYLVTFLLSLNVLFVNTSMAESHLNLRGASVNFPCDIRLNTQMTIAPKQITFLQANSTSTDKAYTISKEQLFINDVEVSLSNKQKQAINRYDFLIRDTLLDVNLFLIDAFSTAKQSINQDFSALLGANSQPIRTASNEVTKLQTKFSHYFNPANNVVIDNKGAFIEAIIEQNVDNYIGSLSQQLLSESTVTLMSSMLASGESFSQIQTKVSAFSKQFKTTIKQHKNELNANAKKLCIKLNDIDKAEQYMHNRIPELATIDMFTL